MILPQGYTNVTLTFPTGKREFVIFVDTKKKQLKVWDNPRLASKHMQAVLFGDPIPEAATPIAGLEIGGTFSYEGIPAFKVLTFRKPTASEIQAMAKVDRNLAKAFAKIAELQELVPSAA